MKATLTGSTMGAGAPETERRQHARARTTKPFGICKNYFDVFLFIFFFSFYFLRPGYLSYYISIAAAFSTIGAVSTFSRYSCLHHLETVICILHCWVSFIIKLDSSYDSEPCGLLWSICYISIVVQSQVANKSTMIRSLAVKNRKIYER